MALSGWAYFKNYVIDISVIDSDQSNYVAQFYMSASCCKNNFDFSDIFTKLGGNYKKIAFEFNDSEVECYAEMVQWDSSAKLGLFNVRIPNIYSATEVSVKVYYDPTHADNTTYIGDIGSTVGGTVYDSSFTLAHQMANDPSGTPPQLIDSTSNSYDGTSYGTMTSGDLVNSDFCGLGQDLDGVDDYFSIPTFDNAIFTVEVVVKYDTLPTSGNFNRIISKYSGTGETAGSWNINIVESSGSYLVHMSIANGSAWTQVYLAQSLSVGTTYYITGIADGTNFRIYLGETQLNSVSGYSVASLSQAVTIGADNPNNRWVDGVVSLIRVSSIDRGSDFIKITNHSIYDSLFTITGATFLVQNDLEKLYGAGDITPRGLNLVWGLMHDPAFIGLDKLWNIFYGLVLNDLIKIWGISIEAVVNKPYSNAAVAIISIVKRFSDASTPQTALIMKYDDALMIEAALSKIYHIMFSATTSVNQPYTITEAEVKTALEQLYSLAIYNEPLRSALTQVYGIIGNYSNIKNFNSLSVLASGIAVYPNEITITEDLNQYCIRAEMIFKSQSDYAVIQKNGSLTFSNGTTTYEFFVAEKRRSRSRSGLNGISNDYVIVGLSWAASLDHPYHLPITQDWPNGGLASDIVQEISGDITIDWQIVDWTIPPATLFANNETPIQIIRKIIRDRGVMQDNASGKTISIVKEYAISPPKWIESAADYTLSDLDDIETISEQEDERSGVNKIIVTNQLSSDKRLYISDEQINSYTRHVKGYRTPWIETFTLDHSGGSWVSIINNGIINELIEKEFIEFIDGIGRASKPIYSISVIDWQESSLGGLTFAEDGTLESAITGNSIAEVSYYTRYRSWTVRDNKNEKVQVFLRVTDND